MTTMNTMQDHSKLAQSASALGASLFGFGIGAKWGAGINGNILLIVLIIGAIIHVAGMYVMQMKNNNGKASGIARVLWISAWICLIAVIAIIVYSLLN